VWQNAMVVDTPHLRDWAVALQLLVQYGADPNATMDSKNEVGEGEYQAKRTSALRYLRWRTGVLLLHEMFRNAPQTKANFQAEMDKLFELLRSKGARDEEWHRLPDDTFKQTYTEPPTIAPLVPERVAPAAIQPRQNTFKRLKRWLQRLRLIH